MSSIEQLRPLVRERRIEVSLRGAVCGSDQKKRTFELQPIYGDKVSAPIAKGHLATVVEAFKGREDGRRVLVQGAGWYDWQNRLRKLDSVDHIRLLDRLDVAARLAEFREMEDGWL